MKNLIKLFALSALAAGLTFAQTIVSTTTLGAAVTTASQGNPYTTVVLASTSTMLSAGSQNNFNTMFTVDQELFGVVSVVDSTHVTVRRGQGSGVGSKPTTHANGQTVFFFNTLSSSAINPIAAGQFFTTNSGPENWGSCTATALLALPRINTFWGTKSDCIGGQWIRTDAPGYPSYGSSVTAAASITLTGTSTPVTGATQITTIVVPNGAGPGFQVTLFPTGTGMSTGTGGNIALATTIVQYKALIMTWNGTSWYPSY